MCGDVTNMCTSSFQVQIQLSLLPTEPTQPNPEKEHASAPAQTNSPARADLASPSLCMYLPFANAEVVFYVLLCGVAAVVIFGLIIGVVLNSIKRHMGEFK